MNLLDILIIVTLAFFLVRGIFRGFFREMGSLVGVVLGLSLAILYQSLVAGLLSAYLPQGKFLPVISFALIFLVIVVACNLMSRVFHRLFAKALLGGVDRILGGATAVLKGGGILYFAILFLIFFVPSRTPLIAQSRMAPVVIGSYNALVRWISPDAHRRWKQQFLRDGPDREVFSKLNFDSLAKSYVTPLCGPVTENNLSIISTCYDYVI